MSASVSVDPLAQTPPECRPDFDLLAGDFQMIGGQIVGQQHPVTVINKAASRRQRLQADSIAVGQSGELLVVQNL
jgi:hypothetical protein